MRQVRRAGRVVSVLGSVVAVVAGAAVTSRRRHRPDAKVVPAPATPGPVAPAEPTELGAFGVQPAVERVDGIEIHVPAPSVWPAVLGLGLTLLLFGIVTSLVFSALGALLIIWALWGWIKELRYGG